MNSLSQCVGLTKHSIHRLSTGGVKMKTQIGMMGQLPLFGGGRITVFGLDDRNVAVVASGLRINSFTRNRICEVAPDAIYNNLLKIPGNEADTIIVKVSLNEDLRNPIGFVRLMRYKIVIAIKKSEKDYITACLMTNN